MGILENKVALVTGGGSGIGKAISAELAKEGAAVVVTDIDADSAQATADAIEKAGGRAASMRHDATALDQHLAAVEFAVEKFGALHLAVNNAGIGESPTPLADKDMAEWDKVIALNLTGVAYGCHAQLKQFLTQGGDEDYAIVNMGSIHSIASRKGGISAYTAAKHGVSGLTKSIAADYADQGIRCNAVCPGYIDTPLLKNADDKYREYLAGLHPQGRLGTADEVAKTVAFLLSDGAAFINGSSHLIDGGYTAV